MNCFNCVDGNCLVASTLAGQNVTAHESTCAACKSNPTPMRDNNVTRGLAIATLMVARKPVPESLHIAVVNSGPGTELRKLIAWLPVPKKAGCRTCKSLELRMNLWGPELCEQKLEYIVGKLRIAAKRRSIPFIESGVRQMVRIAILSSKGAVN